MNELFEYVTEAMKQNDFLSGGAVLMVLGSIGVWCRKIPVTCYRKVKNFFWIDLEIRNTDPAFKWITKWLSEQNYSVKRARRLYMTTDNNGDVNLAPGFGRHWFMHRGRLVILDRELKEGGGGDGGGVSLSQLMKPEAYQLRVCTRNRNVVNDLIAEAKELFEGESLNEIRIKTTRWGCWNTIATRLKRCMESVVLKKGQAENLMKDIRDFLNSKQWYLERGVPYRRGYLFHGPPGSGKSSIITAIASELGFSVCLLNLSDRDLDDTKLRDLIAEIPDKSLLVIEDIDCGFRTREEPCDSDGNETPRKGITLSGLLNALDGIAAGEGRILIATTNHPENLDPALIRPGRIDRQFRFSEPDASQKRRIFKRFFPEATDTQMQQFVQSCDLKSMAAIQSHLITYNQDPQAAIQHMKG